MGAERGAEAEESIDMARDERQWRRGSNRHPTGLVALERTICLELVLEYPLASDNIRLRWSRKEIPCVVGK